MGGDHGVERADGCTTPLQICAQTAVALGGGIIERQNRQWRKKYLECLAVAG